jgi:uncharacterized RDD family membrane protein YckC
MMEGYIYAGFWIRVAAALIDSLWIGLITIPLLYAIYGASYFDLASGIRGFWDVVFSYLAPACAIIVFWSYRSATPGKMILRLTIVDASTGASPSTRQFVLRYLGYYLATIPLLLGILWVGIDRRKQGWHDKLAGTVVIRDSTRDPTAQ